MSRRRQLESWQALERLATAFRARHLRALYAADPGRADRYVARAAGLTLEYGRQRVDDEILAALGVLAEDCRVREGVEAMFAGQRINCTENRAALHVALRAPADAVIAVDGENVMPAVHAVLDRMRAFSQSVREGAWTGYDGRRITDVVNIGIGGSDLGPRMVCHALSSHADGPRAHFIANVDGAPLQQLLERLDPARTLFIVTSKTFTTQETMANARAARAWLVAHAGEGAVGRHFAAVSTNHEAVAEFGIDAGQVFGFWDWVGGRYSLWSAVGLVICIALGFERFRELLDGAAAMDAHFREAPPPENLPMLMAMLQVWNRNFLKLPTQLVVPYRDAMALVPAWLQQLEMESNGKRVSLDGQVLDIASTPPLWGDVGTNAQHAFFQMLHQGTEAHAVDFIVPVAPGHRLDDQHAMLLANAIAQASALAFGRDPAEVRAELGATGLQGEALEQAAAPRDFPGNRPCNLLLMDRLDAWHLGALLALYEHRTFVLSRLWGINAFDQWGVELGKRLAQGVLASLQGGGEAPDAASAASLRRIEDRWRCRQH